MTSSEKKRYANFFRKDLLTNILPFWEEHAIDKTIGGYTEYLDRQGNLLSDEKGGWFLQRN